jgi:hypothetical protein
MSSFDYGDADPYGSYSPASSPAAYTPSAGTTPPSADITVAPGFTPDYSALLGSDAGLAAAKSAADANQQAADAARRAAVRSAYVQYGGSLPSGWSDKYGDIDQATQDAAAGNQFSTISNLQHNYSQSVEQFRKALAARGALQSGELNYGQDQLDRGLGQGRYDAANAFTNSLGGAYSQYAGVLGQNARDLASAVGGAQSNVFNNPANRPVAPTVAHYDTSLSAKYGRPVYTDEWGTVYDQSGNVLVAGTPPPAPAPVAPVSAPADSGFTGYTDASSGGGYTAPSADTGFASPSMINQLANVAQNYTPAQITAIQNSPTYDPWGTILGSYSPSPVSGYSPKSNANLH